MEEAVAESIGALLATHLDDTSRGITFHVLSHFLYQEVGIARHRVWHGSMKWQLFELISFTIIDPNITRLIITYRTS